MDNRLRQLERKWRETGSEQDAELLLLERIRSSGLDHRRLLGRLWRLETAVDNLMNGNRVIPDDPSAADLLTFLEDQGPLDDRQAAPPAPDPEQLLAQEEEQTYQLFLDHGTAYGFDLRDADRDSAVSLTQSAGPVPAVLSAMQMRLGRDARRSHQICAARGYYDLHQRFLMLAEDTAASARSLADSVAAGILPLPVNLIEEAVRWIDRQQQAFDSARQDLVEREGDFQRFREICPQCDHSKHDGQTCDSGECSCRFNAKTSCSYCFHRIHYRGICGYKQYQEQDCECRKCPQPESRKRRR